MSRLIIHGPIKSRAQRVIWMANELGLTFERRTPDFRDGNTRTPAYLAINRAGHVPAIEIDGFTMGESCAINIYLAEKFGKLMPEGLEARAQVLEWSFWVMTDVERRLNPYIYHKAILPEAERDPNIVAWVERELPWPMTVIDRHLAEHEWLVGGDFSVADLNAASVFFLGLLAQLDFSGHPNLKAWLDRCLARPAFEREEL